MTIKGLEIARSLGIPIYDHKFGGASERNMKGVLPELIDVARLAICICEYDGTILSTGGVRTQEEATRLGFPESRHCIKSDGFGHALDIVALTPGKGIDWQNKKAFAAMATAAKTAGAILSFPTRQGSDWNMNGVFGEAREHDWPHVEHPKAYYLVRAINEMERTRRLLGLGEKSISERLDTLEIAVADLQARPAVES